MKPELIQSVLEISTDVCRNAGEAAGQLEELRRRVRETAEAKGLTIGSAATHPFAKWEDQRIVERERYHEIVDALGFVARQELLFGLHVHVGIDDPEKAIHVANGMRVHIPILLALSTNSPFWRGSADRPDVHRARRSSRLLPRVGIPPRFENWAEYQRADRVHGRGGRGAGLHVPVVGRAARTRTSARSRSASCDAQTRLEHTIALDGPDPGDVQGAGRALRGRATSSAPFPRELLEENKWLAARYGLQGELIDLPAQRARAGARSWPGAWSSACARTPASWAREREFEVLEDLIEQRHRRATASSPSGARTGTWSRSCARSSRRPRAGRARRRRRSAVSPWRSLSGPMLSLSIVRPYLAWIGPSCSRSGGPPPARCGAISSK